MLLLRVLARLVGVLWVLALATLALGIAIYCLDANGLIGLGSLRPDRLAHLGRVQARVGGFLHQLAASGPVASLSLLCGLAAVLVGFLLLVATLRRPRERLALMDTDSDSGTLAARPSTLRAMIRVIAERPQEVISVGRPKLSLSRRGSGGRVTVRAVQAPTSETGEVEQALARALEPLTSPFSLRLRTRVKRDESTARGS